MARKSVSLAHQRRSASKKQEASMVLAGAAQARRRYSSPSPSSSSSSPMTPRAALTSTPKCSATCHAVSMRRASEAHGVNTHGDAEHHARLSGATETLHLKRVHAAARRRGAGLALARRLGVAEHGGARGVVRLELSPG